MDRDQEDKVRQEQWEAIAAYVQDENLRQVIYALKMLDGELIEIRRLLEARK